MRTSASSDQLFTDGHPTLPYVAQGIMDHLRMKLAVSGLTDVEATEGLPHLLDEFQQRPWLLKVAASWNSDGGNPMVQVQGAGANREHQEGISGFIRAEDWACIIA